MQQQDVFDSLVSSQDAYTKHLPTVLRMINNSRNKMQTIKDILLYCKSTFAVGTSPITKLISMQLVRDVVQYEETDDTMRLVEQILLKKIVEVCSNQRRPSLADLNAEQRQNADQFVRICLEAINIWSTYDRNKNQKFWQAKQILIQKNIKFPTEYRYFQKTPRSYLKNQKTQMSIAYSIPVNAVSSESGMKQSMMRSISPPHPSSNDTILAFLDKYEQIRAYIREQFTKQLKNPTHKIDIYKIIHKLNKFYDNYRQKYAKLSTDSNLYERCSQLNQILKELLKRLKHDGLDNRQMIKLIERTVLEEDDRADNQEDISIITPEYVAPKHFDIFSILQNIHRRIEAEEKKAGLFGTYEFSKQLGINQGFEEAQTNRVPSEYQEPVDRKIEYGKRFS